jgi:hypothetical protein
MTRPLRVAAWVIGGLALLAAFVIIPPLWNYTSWFPKVLAARISVDGRVAPNSRFYAAARNQRAVVLKQESGRPELYFVGVTPNGSRFVWRCEDHSFSFVPGLAFSNHVQFGRGCMAGNFGVDDQDGNSISRPNHDWRRDLQVGSRFIAFTAEDGKRVRVEW